MDLVDGERLADTIVVGSQFVMVNGDRGTVTAVGTVGAERVAIVRVNGRNEFGGGVSDSYYVDAMLASDLMPETSTESLERWREHPEQLGKYPPFKVEAVTP